MTDEDEDADEGRAVMRLLIEALVVDFTIFVLGFLVGAAFDWLIR